MTDDQAVTSAMRAHLDQETTRLDAIWRITRVDGEQLFFTDHDRDIVFAGDTCRAPIGFDRSAITTSVSFSLDNLEGGRSKRAALFEPGKL